MGGACSMHGRNLYKILSGNPEEKRPLEKSRCMCVDWIYLAQDSDQCQALVKIVMTLWFI
jgi:hypothetical protein